MERDIGVPWAIEACKEENNCVHGVACRAYNGRERSGRQRVLEESNIFVVFVTVYVRCRREEDVRVCLESRGE